MIDALAGGRRAGLPLASIWDVYYDWVSRSGKGLSGTTIRQRRRVCSRFAEWATEYWTAVQVAGAVDRACANGFAEFLSKSGMASRRYEHGGRITELAAAVEAGAMLQSRPVTARTVAP